MGSLKTAIVSFGQWAIVSLGYSAHVYLAAWAIVSPGG